jgi:hypothetical protein
MARTSPQDTGKEFAAGVLQHLPDALRSQMETFLASPDAVGFLTEVGNGALRQADYSRNMNALQTWHGELSQWVQDTQAAAAAPAAPAGGGAPATPATPTPTPATPSGLTREDVANEFGRREAFYAAFTADAVRLSQQHFANFGEVLDINQLLNHPRLAELRMDGAYQDVFKDKISTRNADIQAKERKKLEDEIRAQVLTELGQQPHTGSLPYVVGGEGSPLDHLTPNGEAAKPFDPNAVAAMYHQLVSSKA